MTSINTEENVLKSDTRGRVRVTQERREALLAEFERSGLSALRFAKLAGIKYPTFALWVAKRRKARKQADGNDQPSASVAAATQPVLNFVEAFTPAAAKTLAAKDGLMIELPGGVRCSASSSLELRLAAELIGMLASRGGVRAC